MSADPSWDRVKDIVADALELPDERRAEFVRAACDGDSALAREVDRLLAESDSLDDFLEPSNTPWPVPLAAEPPRLDDQVIGGYRIRRTLAAGGMGTVYEAEQEHPNRRVALKVLRGGVLMAEARRRFELEVEVLGRLVHESIARIYDAGMHRDTSGTEHPFLVMELVDGADLVTATAGATLDAKIALVARICDGVQFAHSQGIVHRDLKPANVLVTEGGAPKILDFGIARIASEDAERRATMQTEVGQILGTVAYMSPEQLSGDPTRIDFRTDVYSLGVVLYEMVTGDVPHAVGGLGIAAAARAITEVDPAMPASLTQPHRGDLARIVAMALEKDPNRRYQSPGELGADLRRLLRHEPIAARTHSAFYQIVKFGRRHRTLVAGAAAVFVALLAGFVVASIGLVRADRAREEAEAVNAFLDRMLASAAPEELGRDVEVRTLLDLSAAEIDDEFGDRPHVRGRLHQTVGNSYRNLGRLTEAEHHLRIAVELAEQRYGAGSPSTLDVQHDLAQALLDLDRLDDAAVEIAPSLSTDLDAEDRWLFYNALALDGTHRQANGDLVGAIEQLERAVAGLADTLGPDSPDTLSALNHLAGAQLAAGHAPDAEATLRRLIEVRRRRYDDDHPRVLVAEQNLAVAFLDQEKAADAVAQLRRIVDVGRRVFGPDHPLQLTAEHNLGDALDRIGEHEESLRHLRATAEARERVLGADHEDTLVTLNAVAVGLMQTGAHDEAAPMLGKVLRGLEANGRGRSTQFLISLSNRAAALANLGRTAEAATETRRALELCVEIAGPGHPQTLATRNNLACLVRDDGDLEGACELFAENLEIARRDQPDSPTNAIHFAFNYGRCLASLERHAEAEPHLLAAFAAVDGRAGIRDPERYRQALARCYEALGRPADAARYR